MPIRDRTPYREHDYAGLINACRQRSKYRWAALYEARPPHLARGARAFHLPEGILVLARGPARHLPELRDLTQHPLRLRVHLLTWDPTRDRLRLQINRWYAREKAKIVEEMCGSAYWRRAPGGTAPKSVGELFVSVNRITRELRSIDTWAYVNPATRIAYDRRARRAITRWLVGVARMPLAESRRQVRRYLVTWTRPTVRSSSRPASGANSSPAAHAEPAGRPRHLESGNAQRWLAARERPGGTTPELTRLGVDGPSSRASE